MKNKFIMLSLLLVLIAVWYWLQEKPSGQDATIVINTTGKETANTATPIAETKEKESSTETKVFNVTDWELPTNEEQDYDRTYMQVYTDLKLSQRCHSYYKDEHDQKELFNSDDYFLERIINPIITSYEPSKEQLASFREFTQACDSLKKATFIRAGIDHRFPEYNGKYPVINELQDELDQTKPQIDAEISLKNVLTLKKQWQEIIDALMTETKGELVMTEEEQEEARNELMELSQQMMAMSEQDEIDVELMQSLMPKIQELREAMQATQGGDEEARAQLLVEFQQAELELRRYLHSPHLNTFLEAMSALEFAEGFDLRVSVEYGKFQFNEINKHIPEYISPSHVLSEMSGIVDKSYYDALIGAASALYLCQRGYECSETSELVTDYCWGPSQKMSLLTGQLHKQACGLSVKGFIENHFMTKNQAKDVKGLINLMGEMYAQ